MKETLKGIRGPVSRKLVDIAGTTRKKEVFMDATGQEFSAEEMAQAFNAMRYRLEPDVKAHVDEFVAMVRAASGEDLAILFATLPAKTRDSLRQLLSDPPKRPEGVPVGADGALQRALFLAREDARNLREVLAECQRHTLGAVLTRDVGVCKKCGGHTSSGMQNLCHGCNAEAVADALAPQGTAAKA